MIGKVGVLTTPSAAWAPRAWLMGLRARMPNAQIEKLLATLRTVLGEDVVAVYLFGSSVLGGLRPGSDLDVMAVSSRRLTRGQKGRIAGDLLQISGKPRHLELTIVAIGDVRPWRYPPRMDFQYGDWWRGDFERGEIEPWTSATNPDLASLITMVLLADTPLHGPPPGKIFEPIPRDDYVTALVHGIDELIEEIETDTFNVVLTLARIWCGIVTGEVRSKDAAADWVLQRLPSEHRAALAEARALYLGDQEEESVHFKHLAAAYAEHITATIRGLPDARAVDGRSSRP
jgi:predicted nucleotidyltransferase